MPMVHASAVAGACAGLVSSILTCPLDVVKTKLQAEGAQQSITARFAREAAARAAASRGITGAGVGAATTSAAAATAAGQSAKVPIASPLAPEAVVTPRGRGAVAAAAVPVAQGEAERRYRGLVGTIQRIWVEDGVRGFYRGLGPTIFGYLPTWAIYFTVYDASKSFLARDSPHGDEDFLNHILSAMTAGAISTCCTSPLWVVKTRFMLQSNRDKSTRPYRHTGDAFVQIWKTEGFRGFYAGLLPSLFGVSHVAVQFPLYEAFKGWSRERAGTDELQPSVILLCSSSAKMIASVLTYPHEVLRTRLQMQPRLAAAAAAAAAAAEESQRALGSQSQGQQTRGYSTLLARTRGAFAGARAAQPDAARGISHMGNKGGANSYSGVIQACVTIAKEEGVRGFYRGMGVNLVRTVPSSALTILTYEVMMHHLTADDAGDHDDYEDTLVVDEPRQAQLDATKRR